MRTATSGARFACGDASGTGSCSSVVDAGRGAACSRSATLWQQGRTGTRVALSASRSQQGRSQSSSAQDAADAARIAVAASSSARTSVASRTMQSAPHVTASLSQFGVTLYGGSRLLRVTPKAGAAPKEAPMKRLLMYLFLAMAVVVPSAAWAASVHAARMARPAAPAASSGRRSDETGWNASNASSFSAACRDSRTAIVRRSARSSISGPCGRCVREVAAA